jgi:drug/metabolite transporter (DMT)-like permease
MFTSRSISKPGAAAILTVLLWASAFVAIRHVLRTTSPTALSVSRLAVASTAFLVVLGVRREYPSVARRDVPLIVLAGFLGMTAYQMLLNIGEVHVDAATASMLVNTGPIMTLIGGRLVFGEHLTKWGLTGAGVAAAGAMGVAITADGTLRLSTSAILILLAATSQAGYFLVMKRILQRMSALHATASAMFAGTVLIFPAAFGTSFPRATDSVWLAIIFLGIGPSAIGFLAWSFALRSLPVGITSLSLYAVPLITLVLGALFLSEHPSATSFAAGAVALLGVGISRYQPNRNKETKHSTVTAPHTRLDQ